MRAASCLFALALLSPAFLAVAAQQPACDGGYNIIRVSQIVPGKMETFLSAVSAQKAWYKSAGLPDQVVARRVLDTKSGSYSTTEVVTTHSDAGKRPATDAAYDAFVALFRASSTIKNEYITCEVK